MERDRLVPAVVSRREFEIRRDGVVNISRRGRRRRRRSQGGVVELCARVRCEHVFVRNGANGRDFKEERERRGGVLRSDLGQNDQTDDADEVFNAKCLKAMAKKYASDGDSNNYTKKKKKKKVVYVGHC